MGRVLAQYAAPALAWGSSSLPIEISLEGLSPSQVVLGRRTTGAPPARWRWARSRR